MGVFNNKTAFKLLICCLSISTQFCNMAEATEIATEVNSMASVQAALNKSRANRQNLTELLTIKRSRIIPDIKTTPATRNIKKALVSASTSGAERNSFRHVLEAEPIDAFFRQQQQNKIYVKEVEAMNFSYLAYPASAMLAPSNIFDDGKHTYLSFKPKLYRKFFIVSVQHPNDCLETISYSFLDGFLKLDGVFKAIRVSTETSKCEIINKKFFADY